MLHFTTIKCTTVILLLICSGWRTAATCPSACSCDDVTYDDISGISLNCEKLYRRYLHPSISTSLLELLFSFNDFRYLPPRLRNFTELRVLDLSYNKIQVLPNDTFSPNHKLEVFNLSNNYLHIINSRAFAGLQHLRVLDLERNELKKIPGDVFLPLTNILSSGEGEIFLSRNRWQCDCGIVNFLGWFLDHQHTVSWGSRMSDEETVCRTPETLHSRRLDSLSPSDLGNCFEISTVRSLETTRDETTTNMATTAGTTTGTPTPDVPPVKFSASKESGIPPPKLDYSQNSRNSVSHWGLPTPDLAFIAMGTIAFIVLSVLFVFGVLLWRVAKRQRYPISEEYGDGGNRLKSNVISLHSKRCQLPLPDEPTKLSANPEYDFIPAEFPAMMIQAAGTYSEKIIDNSTPGQFSVNIGNGTKGNEVSYSPKETNEYTRCELTYGRSIASNQQYEEPKPSNDKLQYQSTIYALSGRESPNNDTYLSSGYEDMKSLI